MDDEFEQYRVHEPSDEFEQYRVQDEAPKESFGKSLGYAIPRMITDAADSLYNFGQEIPDYYKKAKTEVPASLKMLASPSSISLHTIGQGIAGSQELINSLAQLPKNIASYGENRLNLLPKGSENLVSKFSPEDTTNAIRQLFGEPKEAGEALFRGSVRNAPIIGGIAQLARAMPHLTRRGATRTLNEARQLAHERDIGTLNVNPELIEDARQFLPNTLPNRNALEAAHYGDYNNLFRLQSDVGRHASDYARSFFSAAERSHGRAGLEARNRLLDAIHENLQSQGHHDISELLRAGQRDYRRYMAFRPYRNILGLAALGMMLPKNSLINIANKILSHRTR